jgi:F0F1-type ATP synthase assembly protein I
MSLSQKPKLGPPQYGLNTALVIVVGLGGFLVLAIVLGILLVGLAVDKALGTRPLFTIGLMILSAPVSIYVMYRVATGIISKSVTQSKTDQSTQGDIHP